MKLIKDIATLKENNLKAAFEGAQNDPDLTEVIRDWAALDGESWEYEMPLNKGPFKSKPVNLSETA